MPRENGFKGLLRAIRFRMPPVKPCAMQLRTVAYYLPLASFKSDRDIEYVHQVRVSTRRAVALFEHFSRADGR